MLLAFGFGNLLMLGWLSAAAAPLLIHLWNKRKYREVRWAAVEFLLAAMRRNARRIQIEQWLLLAVRTAVIALVVLAMAEPYLEKVGLRFVPGRRTHKVLVIDGSYSMDYRPTDRSRFARAKQLAAQIVEESPQGDGFTLVLLSAPPRAIVGSPALAAGDFLEEIEALQLPHAGGDLAATLGLVEEILGRAAREHPGLVRHEVYFLTDLGRNTWVPDVSGPGQEALRGSFDRLAERAALQVLDLGQAGSDNLAVTRLEMPAAVATTGAPVTLQAELRNFGNQPQTHRLVELWIDGARLDERFVDLEPGGEATVGFAHRFETPGRHVARVHLGGDLLEIDDNRRLALDVRQQLKVLAVSGRRGSTDYLQHALDPEPSPASRIAVDVVAESGLQETDLDRYDCVLLCNVGQFTSGEARLLESYLRQGGGLVFFLGDRVLPERYNEQLAPTEPGRPRIFPARLGERITAPPSAGDGDGATALPGAFHFDPLDYEHEIVEVFRGGERSGLLTTPVTRYIRLEVPAEWRASRVALAFDSGDPAIVEAPLLGGRSIVVATAASLASVDPASGAPWTTLPAWPSFLPLVHELVDHALRDRDRAFNSAVGETLAWRVPPPLQGQPLALRTPDGNVHPLRPRSDAEGSRWSYDDTWQSGVYRLLSGDPPLPPEGEPLAVNVDTAEGDLTKADVDELPAALSVQTDWQNLDARSDRQIGGQRGLHRGLLYAALGLLFLETFLAWRFGRGRGFEPSGGSRGAA